MSVVTTVEFAQKEIGQGPSCYYLQTSKTGHSCVIAALARRGFQIEPIYKHAYDGAKWVSTDVPGYIKVPFSETDRRILQSALSDLSQRGQVVRFSTCWNEFQRISGAPNPMPEDGGVPENPVRPPKNCYEKGLCKRKDGQPNNIA